MKTEDKQFLATASAIEIIVALQNGKEPFRTTPLSQVLDWLRANREPEYFVLLGCYYDIAVYKVDGTADTGTQNCHPQEIGKWFVSTHAGDFPDAPRIPVQDTFETGYAVACELLGLEKLFQAEQAAGTSLPRTCHGESTSISDLVAHIVREVRLLETMNATELTLYLSTENGELAEAILAEQGKMPGKYFKEPAMGEAADCLVGIVCIMAKHHPDMSPEDIGTNLAKWCNIKMRKYSKKLRTQK
jgi:NTP pyrophosphatase (non-canonical NTP hydrolase)